MRSIDEIDETDGQQRQRIKNIPCIHVYAAFQYTIFVYTELSKMTDIKTVV